MRRRKVCCLLSYSYGLSLEQDNPRTIYNTNPFKLPIYLANPWPTLCHCHYDERSSRKDGHNSSVHHDHEQRRLSSQQRKASRYTQQRAAGSLRPSPLADRHGVAS